MKLGSKISILLLAICQNAWAQGFANLDFESARSVFNGYQLSVTDAFPSWTVVAPFVAHDDISLSGGSISIFDTNPPPSMMPIQGKYFVELVGSGPNPNYGPISLGQIGQIPVGTQSVSYWGIDEGMQITFAGQPLTFVETGSTANYSIYAAEISAYAGQTGQLLFTASPGSGGFLDNIQFSSSPIPEPSELTLAVLGALLLGFHYRRNHPG